MRSLHNFEILVLPSRAILFVIVSTLLLHPTLTLWSQPVGLHDSLVPRSHISGNEDQNISKVGASQKGKRVRWPWSRKRASRSSHFQVNATHGSPSTTHAETSSRNASQLKEKSMNILESNASGHFASPQFDTLRDDSGAARVPRSSNTMKRQYDGDDVRENDTTVALKCADEWNAVSKTCYCPGGQVRFGYGDSWTEWLPVSTSVECTTETFGDPYPDQGKICECKTGVGMIETSACGTVQGALWWPPVALTALLFFTHGARLVAMTYNTTVRGVVEMSLDAALAIVRLTPMICVVFVTLALCFRDFSLTAYDVSNKDLHITFSRPDFQDSRGTGTAIYVCTAVVCLLAVLLYHRERDRLYGWDVAGDENTLHRYYSVRIVACILFLIICLMICQIVSLWSASSGQSSLLWVAILAAVYFMAHAAILDLDPMFVMHRPGEEPTFSLALSRLAVANMNFVPMLCVLLLSLQIKMNASGIHADRNAERIMSWCCIAILLQAALAVACPIMFGGEFSKASGDIVISTNRASVQMGIVVTNGIRWILMGAVLAGMSKLVYVLWSWRTCALNFGKAVPILSMVYLTSYALLWLFTVTSKAALRWTLHAHLRSKLAQVKDYAEVTCPVIALLCASWWTVVPR
eukprot:TRINITY_DN66169_c0_g1_i1.p1 TRINITY_DN66169_c0_g1~~TRINITY_DN66169_c0_g1_i1.p1  ORF type:complete len:637 (-),score=50.25 TRINITY_DN66169_c0_g1_i1:79-1989(-)